jgi:hypothetical protein
MLLDGQIIEESGFIGEKGELLFGGQ